MKKDLSQMLNTPGSLDGLGAKLRMVMLLTWPAVLAQMSNIVMEYIDAAMVGSLGPVQSAAIGLVATSTWLIWGLGAASCTGFAVQVAHRVGAGDDEGARRVTRMAIVAVFLAGLILGAIGVAVSPGLPRWLGGNAEIAAPATAYFAIFAAGMPLMSLTFLATTLLRSSGNMTVPGLVNVAMCFLDIGFNYFLIFPTRQVNVCGMAFTMPGAGMGVAGAALGTTLAYVVAGGVMMWYVFRRSQHLSHPWHGISGRRFALDGQVTRRAALICWPVALERVVMCGAQILITTIVAPLGNAAIAANAFAVTAESLCYAPGYGVGDAATTLVGQSIGAGRKDMAMSFARISVGSGMIIMGVLGAVMWLLAPAMMSLFSTDADILSLGTMALRTEAWAEPMFAAAIVTYGVMVGAGYTVVPACINFGSIWLVRLTLAAVLAPSLGLYGIWLAMCVELCVRGLVFLIFLFSRRWLRKAQATAPDAAALEGDPALEGDNMVM